MEPITDTEIEYAEKLLLPEEEGFNEERRNVIRNLSSLNVQACPGSGKTTVLLAKLLILANRMPFENSRGICVLTHTNVAINEIKDRLALKASVLFQYPNFFGTFQSFVDKFLALPASIHYYNSRPDKINDESYDKAIGYEYNQIPWKNPFNGMLYGRRKKDLDSGKITKQAFDNHKKDTFKQLRLDFVNKKILTDLGAKTNFCDFQTDTGKLVVETKESVIRNGILHFDDAYSLATRYLHDYSDLFSPSFQKRFSFIFFDEMQDTDSHQNEIIDLLFDSPGVVVQKIGDKNQAIYGGRVRAGNIWTPESLPINDSKRFHNAIAEKVKSICIEQNNQLTGNNSDELAIPPTIIVFDNPNQVLEKFGELIVRNRLHLHEVRKGKPNIFKAIGWRKNHEAGELSITSYWEDFQIESKTRKEEFENLNEYFVIDESLSNKGFKFFKDRIISIFLKALEISENKVERQGIKRNYSKTKLLEVLRNIDPPIFDQFQIRVTEWLLNSIKGKDVSVDIADYITEIISDHFEMNNQTELLKFLRSENNSSVDLNQDYSQQPLNVFKYKYSEGDWIDIRVNTIHGVKGETHTATLYLETYYQKKHESERLIEFIKGNYDTKLAKKSQHIESLKMAYVGMTRPSHFLCVALQSSRVKNHLEELSNAGWTINDDLIDTTS
ncbi:MAG: UvrD-helicase domain-containing protein [Cyclobacteriaceae bacterium]